MSTAVRFKRAAAIAAVAVIAVGAVDGVMAQGGKTSKPSISTFTDKRDGKTYKKVTIGKQVWMAENLNYDAPNVKTDLCYENKEDNCAKYGRMYNWATANAACPAGWHLPTDAEWTTLVDYVGGEDIACKKLKSATGWNGNGNGTNDYGFSALPGGKGEYGESGGDSFKDAGNDGYWWSATAYDNYHAWYRDMYYDNEDIIRNHTYNTHRYSVRCVQD